MVDIDWTALEKVGIAGVAIVGFIVIWKVFQLFMQQWKASTEALNRNSEGYEKLSRVFEQSHEREMEFQKEMLFLSKDTNDKVSELHKELIGKG